MKAEIRRPKAEGNPKAEIRRLRVGLHPDLLPIGLAQPGKEFQGAQRQAVILVGARPSDFGLRPSDFLGTSAFLRPSGFGLRIS